MIHDPSTPTEPAAILARPILVVILAGLATFCFAKLRWRLTDGVVIALCFLLAASLVVHPELADMSAHLVGIRRGVDLVVCLVIPLLGLLIVMLLARMREMNLRLTAALRELAIMNASVAEKAKASAPRELTIMNVSEGERAHLPRD